MENIKSNFAFLCDQAFLSIDGKLNIIGIFKNIKGKNFPFLHPQMYAVSSISITREGTYEENIKIVRKRDSLELINLNFNFIAKGKDAQFGVLGQITAIKFEEAGDYEAQIYVNTNLINVIPFKVSTV